MDMVEQVTQALRAAGKDSSYYEFMRDHYPVGWVMDMGLQPDGDELEAEANGMVCFELTRDGPDEWSELPGCGTVTTRTKCSSTSGTGKSLSTHLRLPLAGRR